MVHFFCALYEEARFLIEAFQLKKNPDIHSFPLYEERTDQQTAIRLAITGPGAVNAATVVGYLASMSRRGEEQLIINLGSCGAGEQFPVGRVLLGNKLLEENTGRCYYPDILFRHPFQETEICTSAGIITSEKMAGKKNVVFDMEAAAVYQAASRFYRPDQMLFLKVVSDHGIPEKNLQEYQPGTLHKLMSGAGKEILPFLEEFLMKQPEVKTEESNSQAESLKEALHCSVTMAAEVDQLLRYVNLAGINLVEILEKDRAAGALPCRNKKEGKEYLAQLKRRML